MILAISGGFRFLRERQFGALAQKTQSTPFPLADLPAELGSWKLIEGSDKKLDPEVAFVAGATDSIERVYRDENTGEEVAVVVVYGIAYKVIHLPEVCYPAAGWQPAGGSDIHELPVPGSTPAQYRTVYFKPNSGPMSQGVEVCYTFLNNKEWLPDTEGRWKTFRSHPAMYRILLQRNADGPSFEKSPSESLLAKLIGEINRRVDNPKSEILNPKS